MLAFPLQAQAQQAAPAQKQAYAPDLAVRLICPECKDMNPKIVEEFGSGDLVCGDCGLVLGDRIVDTRSECECPHTFANDEGDDPSRVGAATNPLLEGIEQLDTVISFKDGGSGMARELQRAAARGSVGKNERNMMTAFRDISAMCESISLPKNVSDTAKQLYKRAEEEKIVRGKSADAVVACCILIACRQANVPRTFKEIHQLTRVPKKTLGQCFKAFEQAFDLSRPAPADGQDGAGPASGTSAENLLNRYCNQLHLHASVVTACEEVVVTARNHGIADGRSPISIAGAAIYFTSYLLGQGKSAKDICSVAGVSESTIKLVYKILWQEREKLVKKEWLDSGRAVMDRLPNGESR
ncbi:transcription initiation factor IIB [Rhizoctonia solani AG-1 IA]|uniref:Transcription initiation factor IIB n=1 Tax=Thanatephorus cucumeris (strain AG1-IA) TaxID=983506 RepID=L8X9A2_THACA|nr:transcription initiation factor IIB [Rhizoctonia solani AG-1 IA]